MTTAASLEQAREAFARRAWGAAYALLAAADGDEPLEPGDLERLARAAALTGRDGERDDALERAYNAHLERNDPPGAARCAFWLALGLLRSGEMARGGGWLARSARLVADGPECVEQGYLLVPAGLRAIDEGDLDGAHVAFSEAAAVGGRFSDPDLLALGRLGQAQALILGGEVTEGLALLDEVMVAVLADEVSEVPAGIIYCAAIEQCQLIYDLRRAKEWTAALAGWCAAQPDLVPFRGQCLVHRAEILALQGAWADALAEAQQACRHLSAPPGQAAVGAAHYQCGELHRLRGEFEQAEEAYRAASRWGRTPQPGLARLRLAQGQVDAAAAAIRRLLDETEEPVLRAGLLPTCVEAALAADDVAGARAAADELAGIAADLDAPLLRAVSAHVGGAVLLVEGRTREALASLREASAGWAHLDAPYESARVRVLLGLACREMGDADTAEMELDGARVIFGQLGAAPELARLQELTGSGAPDAAGLTSREAEILRLVAAGKSNRAVAGELVISEHTVARHLQNIFAKLGVGSRTEAAAYAFEHGLLSTGGQN